MGEPTRSWKRLGHALRAERGSRSLADVARTSGVSARMIQEYEGGKVHDAPPGKLIELAKFYEWSFDTVYRLLDSDDAEIRYAPRPRPIPALPPDTRDQIARMIEASALSMHERETLREQLLEGAEGDPPVDRPNG